MEHGRPLVVFFFAVQDVNSARFRNDYQRGAFDEALMSAEVFFLSYGGDSKRWSDEGEPASFIRARDNPAGATPVAAVYDAAEMTCTGQVRGDLTGPRLAAAVARAVPENSRVTNDGTGFDAGRL